jgi:gluconokinase
VNLRRSGSLAVVVMGVSGSGKSTIGRRLANSLEAAFINADDLHSAANVAKMASGTPPTDEDRWGWLTEVGRLLNQSANAGVVVACSALRRAYRSVITAEAPQAIFVELECPEINRTDPRSTPRHAEITKYY